MQSGAALGAVAFGVYLLISLVLIGRPVLDGLDSSNIGYGPDPSFYMWDLKWWPQAIFDGTNPLHAGVVYAPDGFNTTLTTSMAAPSMLLAPLTQTAGPLVSYNVLEILIPAINGWAMFLLCRALDARFWAGLAGGYIFGFSTYVLGQSLGHPYISLVAVAPLALYLVVRRLGRTVAPRRFFLGLTALLVFQFLTAVEVFFTMTLAAIATAALAWFLFPARRGDLWPLYRIIISAYALTGLLVSPYLITLLTADQHLNHVEPLVYSADPLNSIIPTRLSVGGSWVASLGDRFTGNLSENGTYFGLPLMIALGLFVHRRKQDRFAVLLGLVFLGAIVTAMGGRLNILGSPSAVRLPWTALGHLPIFEYVLPVRLALYAWLALGVAVALWLSDPAKSRGRGLWARWALVGVGVVSILPDPGATDPRPPHYGASIWSADRSLPTLFKSGGRALFDGHPTLLVLPYNEADDAPAIYWQAATGMAFKMPGGYVSGTIPENFSCWPIVDYLRTQVYVPREQADLRRFIVSKGVDGVLAPPGEAKDARPLLAGLRTAPRHAGGVLVYPVPSGPRRGESACP